MALANMRDDWMGGVTPVGIYRYSGIPIRLIVGLMAIWVLLLLIRYRTSVLVQGACRILLISKPLYRQALLLL